MNKRKSRTAPIRKVKIFVSGDGPHQRISSFETVDDVTLADCLLQIHSPSIHRRHYIERNALLTISRVLLVPKVQHSFMS